MGHSHRFVEEYTGIMAFGLDRKTDEETLICYLQKFSDDALMQALVGRLSAQEMDEVLALITGLMKNHLSEGEYHKLFLKE